MGFLSPKMPPPPPPPPRLPVLPPASPAEFTSQQVQTVKAFLAENKKGLTETILPSPPGDESEADTYKKTLLGG